MENRYDPSLTARARTMQIIATALCVGVFSFMVVAVALSQVNPPQANLGRIAGLPLLSAIAIALFILQMPVALLLPHVILQANVKQAAAECLTGEELPTRLLAAYQTAMIIRLALFEGVGFLACIATILEGPLPAIIIAALSLICMIVNFPATSRIDEWLDQQQRRVDEGTQ